MLPQLLTLGMYLFYFKPNVTVLFFFKISKYVIGVSFLAIVKSVHI